MSGKGGELLRAARKAAGMSQTQVYIATRISESNLQRWEVEDSRPNLEDLYKLELLYHSPGLWSQYLLETSPAYAAHHAAAPIDRDLLAQVVSVGKESEDTQELQDRVERDLIDGQIDCPTDWVAYVQQMRELNAASGAVLLKNEVGGLPTDLGKREA